MIYNNLLDLIGNTPVVKVNFKDENIADVYVKLEKFNLSGSVKDRDVYKRQAYKRSLTSMFGCYYVGF